jgi:hypothetical protein
MLYPVIEQSHSFVYNRGFLITLLPEEVLSWCKVGYVSNSGEGYTLEKNL